MAETATKKNVATEKEMFEVFVPIDQQNPKETTLPVVVNGKMYLVKRGTIAHVPEAVYEVLKFKGMSVR